MIYNTLTSAVNFTTSDDETVSNGYCTCTVRIFCLQIDYIYKAVYKQIPEENAA